jgi:histidinol-phosphate aminotransferase
MSDFEQFIPAHIRAIKAYSPGKPLREAERETSFRPIIKLASNENPFGPSPRALEAMRAASAQGNFYPDNDAAELRRRLAELYRVDVAQIVVTAGSTQFLDIIARTLLKPGLNAVTSERSFIVYPIAVRAAGGELIQVPTRHDGFDLDAILAAIDPQTRIVFIANPNNPTGTMCDAAAAERFLSRLPAHVLLVLDEAYCDFAEAFARRRGIEYSRSLDYVRQGRNLVVLRTFSKSHGLAGIRVGYGLGPAELMQYFARVRPAFSISTVAEAGALAALDDQAHIRTAVENTLTQSVWLVEQLRQLALRPVPTSANFVYFETPEDAATLASRLQSEGVIVRPLNLWGIPNAIRVTIGTPEQNRQFISALKQVSAKTAAR